MTDTIHLGTMLVEDGTPSRGQQTFSPGTYTIAKNSSQSVLALRETATSRGIFVPVTPGVAGGKKAVLQMGAVDLLA
jgi:hypothetical protein